MKTGFNSFYTNRLVLNLLEKSADNAPLVASGSMLLLSLTVRPTVILSTPNVKKKDKEYQCAKSILSSAINFTFSDIAFKCVKQSIDKISNSPQNYLNNSTIKKLGINTKAFNFIQDSLKYIPVYIALLPKALITASLLTPLKKMIFDNRNKNDLKNKSNIPASQITFKGASDKITQNVANIFNNDKIQDFALKHQNTNFFQHAQSLRDVFATLCFSFATLLNRNIDKESKNSLILNSFTSTILTISGSYIADKLTQKQTEKVIEKFKSANLNSPKTDKYIKGINVLKPIITLGTMYYAIIPMFSALITEKFLHKNNTAKANDMKLNN